MMQHIGKYSTLEYLWTHVNILPSTQDFGNFLGVNDTNIYIFLLINQITYIRVWSAFRNTSVTSRLPFLHCSRFKQKFNFELFVFKSEENCQLNYIIFITCNDEWDKLSSEPFVSVNEQ